MWNWPPQEVRGRRIRVILLPVTWRPELSSCQISCNVPVQKKKRLLNPILCAQAKSLSHQQPISVQTSAASRSCPCILMNSSKGSNYKVLWHLRHLRCHKTMFVPKDPYFIMNLLHCRRLLAFFSSSLQSVAAGILWAFTVPTHQGQEDSALSRVLFIPKAFRECGIISRFFLLALRKARAWVCLVFLLCGANCLGTGSRRANLWLIKPC